MSVGTGSAGGFAVPFQLDPSIMISGTGALNPLRQIARVETIEGYQWRGVSADQVTAAYGAEAAEVADASPTLVQPTVTPQRGTAFVPFSIELQQDYATLMSELGRVLADARDVLDATKFVTGSGTNEPVGLLTVGTGGALTTTQRIQTTTVATFAVGDPWLLKAGLAPRFINNTSVVAHPGVFDTIYRFTGGNAVEPPIIPTRDGPCFGRPKYWAWPPSGARHVDGCAAIAVLGVAGGPGAAEVAKPSPITTGARKCDICHALLSGRSHSRTCSARCRKAKSRRGGGC